MEKGAVVLILGNTGLLGQAVEQYFASCGYHVVGASRNSPTVPVDISNRAALANLLNDLGPDLVFNCAALIDIEQCEKNFEQAWAINVSPVLELSRWAQSTKRRFVHISTDQFFTGEGRLAHSEECPVTLLNNYAKSKYVSEQIALSSGNALVLRTAIIGIRGWEKLTFAEWALDAVLNDRAVRLFEDAFTSAIDVNSFVKFVHVLLCKDEVGLFNVASSQVYSKAEFVFELAKQLGRHLSQAQVGSVREMSSRRADSLGLDASKVMLSTGKTPPSLEEVVANVLKQYSGRI
ncbi:sugar nucleotide-binding protein [Pusillimonas sp. CC-YST705]|uniref:Sugar nucleotide-binding protein n=1 Tax=Mesopusillimonas faecipullorum TaxID=2755040 RepID=A0ABS8CAZ5_9BURK|nr:sugar nucleotide-binding protein [Mesopusillimonas faecipullorum]MCB5363032.1 sugar nucleotide-binding protein [Mesopusillimonas faecipullorum]